MEDREHGFPFISLAVVAAVVIFVGHAAMQVLPSTLAGLPTSAVVVLGMIGTITAAVRWL
jgi:hypothetical protein